MDISGGGSNWISASVNDDYAVLNLSEEDFFYYGYEYTVPSLEEDEDEWAFVVVKKGRVTTKWGASYLKTFLDDFDRKYHFNSYLDEPERWLLLGIGKYIKDRVNG